MSLISNPNSFLNLSLCLVSRNQQQVLTKLVKMMSMHCLESEIEKVDLGITCKRNTVSTEVVKVSEESKNREIIIR